VSVGAAAAVTAGTVAAFAGPVKKADTLAALGGKLVRTEPIPKWPPITAEIEGA
jgi:hypothetical protein